jgi:uroporphyrinogen-III synthase
MSNELSALVQRHGGQPIAVPSVREDPIDRAEQVSAFIDGLRAGDYPIVVFFTGVGVKALFAQAEKQGRLDALLASLENVITVCRGPKPVAVLKRHGVQISFNAPEPNTTKELLQTMSQIEVGGKNVAVLHYGERNAVFADTLRKRGTVLEELCLYEWSLPDDVQPLRDMVRALISGDFEVIALTSQVQVRHLFQIAKELGLEGELRKALNDKITVASIGPTCNSGLERVGVIPDVVPEHPKMGHLITALAAYLESHQSQTSLQSPVTSRREHAGPSGERAILKEYFGEAEYALFPRNAMGDTGGVFELGQMIDVPAVVAHQRILVGIPW